jgi:hypothetical protein
MLQPGPTSTVGARWPAASPSAGKKCMLMAVWSNDRTTASRACALGASSASVTTTIPTILFTISPWIGNAKVSE